MVTLEAPPSSKYEQANKSENGPGKPFTFKQLTEAIYEEETKLENTPTPPPDNIERLVDLYALLKDVEDRNNANTDVSQTRKYLDTSMILTEIAHARVALFSENSKHLSNTKEKARWHQSSAAFIREVIKTKSPENARQLISSYWREQESIFTHPFRKFPQDVLKETFESHKNGVLASVAFETALEVMPGWKTKEYDLKLDTSDAIDYVATSPEGNTFLVQLTSVKKQDREAVHMRFITNNDNLKNAPEKERKFVNGISRYANQHRIDGDTIRSVFVSMGHVAFDNVTGEPTAKASQEIGEGFASIDERELGWKGGRK